MNGRTVYKLIILLFNIILTPIFLIKNILLTNNEIHYMYYIPRDRSNFNIIFNYQSTNSNKV